MERDRRRSDTIRARGRLAALSALAVAVVAVTLVFGGRALLGASAGPSPGPAATRESPSSRAPAGPEPDASTPFAVVEVTVIRVVDGDTIHARTPDGADETIRFIGVNTPESTTRHEPFGNEASDYTKAKLPVGTTVWLELDVRERDKYGRLLAYVWTQRPSSRAPSEVRDKMFNAALLIEGYAQLMTIPPDVRYVDIFTPLQAEAREAGRGLWGLPVE
ncbi:MAG: thermonuclease family protein [Coriobacteriia bacterium]|nr:thermonuclease family protein [Coriobacteriia bacterium]